MVFISLSPASSDDVVVVNVKESKKTINRVIDLKFFFMIDLQ
jgi:hypothetical protein